MLPRGCGWLLQCVVRAACTPAAATLTLDVDARSHGVWGLDRRCVLYMSPTREVGGTDRNTPQEYTCYKPKELGPVGVPTDPPLTAKLCNQHDDDPELCAVQTHNGKLVCTFIRRSAVSFCALIVTGPVGGKTNGNETTAGSTTSTTTQTTTLTTATSTTTTTTATTSTSSSSSVSVSTTTTLTLAATTKRETTAVASTFTQHTQEPFTTFTQEARETTTAPRPIFCDVEVFGMASGQAGPSCGGTPVLKQQVQVSVGPQATGYTTQACNALDHDANAATPPLLHLTVHAACDSSAFGADPGLAQWRVCSWHPDPNSFLCRTLDMTCCKYASSMYREHSSTACKAQGINQCVVAHGYDGSAKTSYSMAVRSCTEYPQCASAGGIQQPDTRKTASPAQISTICLVAGIFLILAGMVARRRRKAIHAHSQHGGEMPPRDYDLVHMQRGMLDDDALLAPAGMAAGESETQGLLQNAGQSQAQSAGTSSYYGAIGAAHKVACLSSAAAADPTNSAAWPAAMATPPAPPALDAGASVSAHARVRAAYQLDPPMSLMA